MKKAQITLFLLIPIVILASFLLLFSASSQLTKSQSQNQANIIYQEFLENEPVTRYIEECIISSTESAIQQISQQGGFIFQNQNDSIIDWYIPTITKNNIPIAYQIYPPNKYTETTNLYPCYTAGAPVPSIMKGEYCDKRYAHSQNFYSFGSTGEPQKSINPDLCESYNYSRAGYSCFCEECTGYSIETQLESAIKSKLEECINLSVFQAYNFSKGNLSFNLLMENQAITAELNLPLKLNIKGYKLETNLQKFSANLPIRLKLVYDTARDIINKEITEISYNLERDPYELNIQHLKYDIQPLENSSSYLYTITDSKSFIGEENYIFQFAIKNRQPALDYYNPDNCYIDGDYYHVCIIEGENIFLEPIAYDPENQDINYIYSGWKADWDQIWTTTSDNPHPHQETTQIYQNYWHQSQEYQDTKRIATIQTSHLDIGPHNITISTYDQFGLKDEQIIHIFVDDKPSTYFFGKSIYDDIPQDRASLEDPFTLDASATKDYFGSTYLLFKWMDQTQQINYPFSEDNEILEFTFEINNFHSPNKFTNTLQNHNILLQAKSPPSIIGQYQKEIKVTQCLPHKANSAPYPFDHYSNDPYPDLFETDPYQADHTCCSDGTQDGYAYGEIKTGSTCYQLTEYGCLYHFDSSDPRHIDHLGKINQSGINPTQEFTTQNPTQDIFKREFKVKCGTRGNICDGELEVIVTPVEENCTTHCIYEFQRPQTGINSTNILGCQD